MIVVIGEALIDLIENRYQPGAFNAIVGGANANVALALARRFFVLQCGDELRQGSPTHFAMPLDGRHVLRGVG